MDSFLYRTRTCFELKKIIFLSKLTKFRNVTFSEAHNTTRSWAVYIYWTMNSKVSTNPPPNLIETNVKILNRNISEREKKTKNLLTPDQITRVQQIMNKTKETIQKGTKARRREQFVRLEG